MVDGPGTETHSLSDCAKNCSESSKIEPPITDKIRADIDAAVQQALIDENECSAV